MAPLHLCHIGHKSAAYLPALFNLPLNDSIIPDCCRQSIIIPLVKIGKNLSPSASYRPVNHLIPLADILERLSNPLLTSVLKLSDQVVGPQWLFELTYAILEGFNRQKPAKRTVAVSIDPSRASECVRSDRFVHDSVSMNVLNVLIR
ncbi:unnamed protein product [Dibothriocephalus latus]|uniref:Uncharacterized protein n=1 Tax=Dibothriocephalus latus TaxID=60516 RepID=A0A3P7P665_DIBLA|nr:unnamed protein product [Dibothriocephalus latus]